MKHRTFKTKSLLLVLLFTGVLVLVPGGVLSGKIVETVDVTGKLLSDEPHSKNMVIITAADLQEFNIKDMSELFSFFTALNVSKRGVGETSFDITMRGSNFEQVLVLVDGVPMNNPQTGHFNCDFPFSVGDVERVEILRGGSSTTYGAGAFAGMVHIVLKKMSPKPELSVTASGGANNFYGASVQAGKKFKNFGLRFSANKSKSDGYYEGREFDNLKLTAGLFYNKANTQLDFQAGYLKKDFGAQGFYAPYPSIEEIKSYSFRFRMKQTYAKFDYSLTYSYNRHDDYFVLDRDRPSIFMNESDTFQNFVNLTAAYKGGKFNSSVGVEFKGERMDSLNMGERKRNHGAMFMNVNYQLTESTGFDAGLRRNFESNDNSNFTIYTGMYHRLGQGMILRAGYGKSFRLPSFTELYYQSPSNIGNEALKPEISHNFEASLSWLRTHSQSDLSLFYRKQDNLLDWAKYTDSQGGTSPWTAVNVSQHDVLGVELTHRFRVKRTMFTIGIEGLKAVNQEESFISKYGLRFPDLTLKAGVIQPLGKFAKVSANYTYKKIYKTSEKGHFVNLSLTVPIQHVQLGLKMDNVFNSIIEEIPGLKVPGRWLYFTIGYSY